MKSLFGAPVAAFLLLLAPLRADDNQHYLNNGYSLLHDLCDQEKSLDMILIVKTTPKDVADFAHEVSKAAKEDLDQLEDLQDHDKAIRFDQKALPQFELDTRASIKDDKQHMLLFGTTDKNFARALLVTQIEAGGYGMNLAKVLADAEPNAHRAAVAQKISARWEKIRDKAYRLLNAQ
jgi:gas vesicle protein